MFLQVAVILFTGGMPGPRGCLVPGGVPGPRGCLVPGGVWSRGVPGGDPLDGYCCGQYASYWNAFLFIV